MKNILIVDDDPQVVRGLKRAFCDLPFTIHEAHDGTEALALWRTLTPALIILDVVMPGMNGLEVCKAIREAEIDTGVAVPLPIIMLSGKSDDADKVVGKVVGATHYLAKPCAMDTLKALVVQLVEDRRET